MVRIAYCENILVSGSEPTAISVAMCGVIVHMLAHHSSIPTNLQINLCLKLLCVHSKYMGMMHHRLAQKRAIWRFSGGIGSIFCLIIKQKLDGW